MPLSRDAVRLSAWDQFARQFVAPSGGQPPYHAQTNALLPTLVALVGRPGRVLDAGCGEGAVSRMLADSGHAVIGVDSSVVQLSLAYAQEQRRPRGIRYQHLSVTDLACFADDSFDAVLSNQVLPSVFDAHAAICEAARVVHPGGRGVFAFLHPSYHVGRPLCSPGSGGLTLPFYNRSLQSYLRSLQNCGWALDALLDWPRCQRPLMVVLAAVRTASSPTTSIPIAGW